MLILFFLAVLLAVVSLVFYRDRKYLNAKTKDVVSDEMKKILNVPTADDTFDKTLKSHRTQKKPSEKLLDEFNKDE